MDIKKILKDTLVLLVITVVSGFLLGIAYEVTNPVITARKAEEKAASYRTLFTDADHFEDRSDLLDEAATVLADAGRSEEITDIMTAMDASGEVIGYAMSISCSGNQGEIVVAYAYGVDGTSYGIEILSSSETAGLGALASEPAFKNQFQNKNYESFSVVKSGSNGEDEIDAISGATNTSTAVTGAVNAGIIFGHYCAENK
jgi:electron transport complex protein RnfG